MMSPENHNPTATAAETKEETSGGGGGRKAASTKPQEVPISLINCPRCDSPNTKFCYYNNYSLTQPRHFCKTCRRYWTKGGALRNVPIGGGCRKNKKMKSNSTNSRDSKDSSDNIVVGGLKFFQGLPPAMDFQLGGVHNNYNLPPTTRFNHHHSQNNFSTQFSSNPCFGTTLEYPNNSGGFGNFASFQEMGSSSLNFQQGFNNNNNNNNLVVASSIESLSSINQDLHWKLQQQRLAMMFVNGSDHNNHEKEINSGVEVEVEAPLVQKPLLQPILFQNLEINNNNNNLKADHQSSEFETNSKRDGTGNSNLCTEWFFDNSKYNYAAASASASTVNPTPATSSSNVNENTGSSWSTNTTGIQAWNDLGTHYNALP